MARRRMISEELVYDDEFNCLSIDAQLLFIRMLVCSDDCGVVPATENTLRALTNPSPKTNLKAAFSEIVDNQKLGRVVVYKSKPYFLFKPESFRRNQSYIFNKRIKSEYLKISASDFDSIDWSKCWSIDDQLKFIWWATGVESRKYKVESKKIKDRGVGEEEEKKVAHGEFVLLTCDEHKRLTEKLGSPERVERAIEILNHYIGSKGVNKYKSHYHTILGWVLTELKKQEANPSIFGKGNGSTTKIDHAALEAKKQALKRDEEALERRRRAEQNRA